MPLNFQLSRPSGFVRFDVRGEASLADMQALIDAVGDATGGERRVMVNLVDVRESLKFTDHYAIGELVAARLHHLQRLASVVRPERRTGASEKVAEAQGTALRVFVDEHAAIDWLTSD